MGFEQLAQRKARRPKQRRCALIEPAEIVRIENNVRGIAISELDPYANTVDEHNQFRPPHESDPVLVRSHEPRAAQRYLRGTREILSNVRSIQQGYSLRLSHPFVHDTLRFV